MEQKRVAMYFSMETIDIQEGDGQPRTMLRPLGLARYEILLDLRSSLQRLQKFSKQDSYIEIYFMSRTGEIAQYDKSLTLAGNSAHA